MKFFVPLAILAVIIASSSSFRLDPPEENINDDRISTMRVIWQHKCNGAILNNRWIVSCAHCTEDEYSSSSNLLITVGARHIQNDGQIYRLNRIVNHPAYNTENFRNNICLLQTSKIIQYNKFVQPIRLRREFVGADVTSIVSGWGRLQVGGQWPTHLQHVQVNTLTNEDCLKLRRSHLPRDDAFYEGTLCAFARKGQGICFGDSGAPLVTNGKLIGLAQWVRVCAKGFPDGYLRISVFLSWIREVSGAVAV